MSKKTKIIILLIVLWAATAFGPIFLANFLNQESLYWSIMWFIMTTNLYLYMIEKAINIDWND